VCEDGASGVGVHRLDLGRDVVELGQGDDGDEDIGDVETTIVPEEHPHLTVSGSNWSKVSDATYLQYTRFR